MPGVYVSRR